MRFSTGPFPWYCVEPPLHQRFDYVREPAVRPRPGALRQALEMFQHIEETPETLSEPVDIHLLRAWTA